MKWVKRIGLVLLIVVLIVVVAFNIWRGRFLKGMVETGGPVLLGVPVKVDSINYRLLRGQIQVKGLVIGNPKGFKTEKAFSLGEVAIEIVPKTVFSRTVIIKRIYVNAPDITYEVGLGKSNIGKILEHMEGEEAPKSEEGQTRPAPAKASEAKKVIIEDLLVENGCVRVSTTFAGGLAAPIPLPPIHLTNIGKEEEGGASVVDVIKKVLQSVVGAVTNVATGAVGAAGDGVKVVGAGVGKALKGVTGLFQSEAAKSQVAPAK